MIMRRHDPFPWCHCYICGIISINNSLLYLILLLCNYSHLQHLLWEIGTLSHRTVTATVSLPLSTFLSFASRWHRVETISRNVQWWSWYDLKAMCPDRSGTWPAENWNCLWPDTSARCVVWQWVTAALICSPVEKTSRSNAGIWSTTRLAIQISCL